MYEWINEVTGLKSDKQFKFKECQTYEDKLEEEWANDVVNVFPTAPVAPIEYIPEEEIPRKCDIEWSGNMNTDWQYMNSHKGMNKVQWARSGAPKYTSSHYPLDNDCIISLENTDDSKIIEVQLQSSRVDCNGQSPARGYSAAERAESGDSLEIISVSDDRFSLYADDTCNVKRKFSKTIVDASQ